MVEEQEFNNRSRNVNKPTEPETISYIIMRCHRQERHKIRRFKWKMCSIADSIMIIILGARPP